MNRFHQLYQLSLLQSDGTGDPMPSPVRSASVAAYLGQVQANNDVNSHRVTPSPSNNSNNNNNNRTTNTRSPHRQHQQRSSSSSSSSSSSKKESTSTSHKSSNRWARPAAASDNDLALTVSSASSASHATTAVTTRSRSPPVVTIAPTLSLSNLSHYQDSRKVRRASFHSLPLCRYHHSLFHTHSLTHSHHVSFFPFFRFLMDLFLYTGLRPGNAVPHGAI